MESAESQSFVPIQSLDLRGETLITFDLYLNLPRNQKVIKYKKKGETLDSSKLSFLLDGNVTNFLVRKEDYKEFVRYVALRLQALINLPDTQAQKTMALSAVKAILTSTFQSSDSAMVSALMGNLNEITSVVIESTLEKISPARKKAYRQLVEFSEKGTDFHRHPVNVTSLSVLISFGIGYSTDRILSEVAMGALLHDIGLAKLPTRMSNLSHDPLSLSRDERMVLYGHGQKAMEILEERKIPVSELVKSIILQHHEQFNGSGYPAGLRGYEINEFSQIVSVADQLDHVVNAGLESAESLRMRIEKFFARIQADKVVEPSLASRIRNLFL